jgi:hypothetical protein
VKLLVIHRGTQSFGNCDRAVFSAGTAYADVEIGFAFKLIAREQECQ